MFHFVPESCVNEENPFKLESNFTLRWFTPTTEVPLCGHATLASAAVLFYTQENQKVNHTVYRTHSKDRPLEYTDFLNRPTAKIELVK